MKKGHLLAMASLLLLQAVCFSIGKLSAQTLSADTLAWSWEVSTTVSTMTKTCTLEFTGPLTVSWGDGTVQNLSDSLSGSVLTHVYSSVANFNCRAMGAGIAYFKADSRRLLSLDPTRSPALTYLSCTSNQLVELDVTKNPELVSLYCGSNALTVLNVSKCTKLQTLTCSDNKLASLDVSPVLSLKKLTCHTNLLTSLKVSPLGSLSYLSCLSCSLQVAELDTLLAKLPALATVSTSKNLYVLNNPGSANCNIQTALNKNWTPDKVMTSSSFYVPTATSNTAENVELDICLTNPVNVIAFELDVVFPSGFVLDTIRTCLAAARKGNHLLSIARTASLQYKFMAYSMTTRDQIKGNSGVVLQLFGKAPDTAKVYDIQLKQAVLVDTTTNMCAVSLTNGSLKVVPASVNGDVNGDKVVDITDIVNLVAYINGRNPSGFSQVAADLDNNGTLNVADITRMVVLINASVSTLRSSQASWVESGRSLVLYDRQNASKGNNLFLRQANSDNALLELCLDNLLPAQACQVDIRLPEGFSIQMDAVSAKTARQNGHQIQICEITPGKYRILLFALRPDAAFRNDTGVLAVLPLRIAEKQMPSSLPIYLDAPVLTGMNLSTIPSKGYDLAAVLGSNLTQASFTAGTDGQNGLWASGLNLTEVSVWDATGKLLEKRQLSENTTFKTRLPKGIYLVQGRTGSNKRQLQKVVVQ